jgi:hypothetical protein
MLFMELARAKMLTRLAAMSGVVFLSALFVLTLADVLSRLPEDERYYRKAALDRVDFTARRRPSLVSVAPRRRDGAAAPHSPPLQGLPVPRPLRVRRFRSFPQA